MVENRDSDHEGDDGVSTGDGDETQISDIWLKLWRDGRKYTRWMSMPSRMGRYPYRSESLDDPAGAHWDDGGADHWVGDAQEPRSYVKKASAMVYLPFGFYDPDDATIEAFCAVAVWLGYAVRRWPLGQHVILCAAAPSRDETDGLDLYEALTALVDADVIPRWVGLGYASDAEWEAGETIGQ